MGKRTRTSKRGSPFRTQLRPALPSAFLLLTAVTLLLLFLLAIPFAAHDPQVTLPTAASARAIDPEFSTVLAVDGAGAYTLNGQAVTGDRLKNRLMDIARLSPQPVVRLRADEHLPYKTIRKVVRLAHQAGIHDVRLEVAHAR